MLEQTSEKFRANFLLRLTKEIIENTETYRSLVVKKEVREFIREEDKRKEKEIESQQEKREEIKKLVEEKAKKESEKISEMETQGLLPELKMLSGTMQRRLKTGFRKIPPLLRIPEPALPETVHNLRPQATTEEIDLVKLNILVRDPLVKVIECNGPDENILVMGVMGRKNTPIKLSKEEIEEIVEKFSSVAKIPVHEGLFKAAIGNLVISAVISEIVGIKFVIRKISFGF